MSRAPDFITEAFALWVETWGWETGERFFYPYAELVFDVGERNEEWPLPKLLGKLWRCTQVMSEDLCDRLNVPYGSTYARAAQGILAQGRRGKYHIPRSGFRVPPPD